MTLSETMEWQRHNINGINRLALLGDKLALRLIEAYRDLHGDKLNLAKQTVWLEVCDDFARRDLMLSTRRIMQDRYGHKLPATYKRLDS
jgi:hypothetical protein